MMGAELQMGDPQGSVSEEALAPQLVAPTTGQVLGASFAQQFSENPTTAGARALPAFVGSTHGTGQFDPNTGDEQQALDPLVPKDQLNKQYGIPGALTFDQDTSDAVAQQLHDHHVAEIQRADILQRNAGTVATGGVARFLSGTAASLLDPLNLAAAFVPGLPEARVAAMLGPAAEGVAGRAAVRAITGASQGIAGAAALQPLQYGLDKLQQDDWDMGTALSQVFYGGLLGGVMHAGLGAFTDRAALPEWAKPIADAPPSLQEDLTKGAISSVATDHSAPLTQMLDLHSELQALQEQARVASVLQAAPDAVPDGRGAHASVFRDGDYALRYNAGEEGLRPVSDAVLQPDITIQAPDGSIAERLPWLDNVGHLTDFADEDVTKMLRTLRKDGLMVGDLGGANFGMHEGNIKVIDPGAVFPIKEFQKSIDISGYYTRREQMLTSKGDAPFSAADIKDIQYNQPTSLDSIRQRMQDIGAQAEAIASGQARPVGDLAAEAQQREVTARAARAPDPTGDPAKDLAAVKQHSQDFNDYVQQQKQLGHWTEGDDNALSKIAEHEALAAGDAKAFATAAACLTSGVAANA